MVLINQVQFETVSEQQSKLSGITKLSAMRIRSDGKVKKPLTIILIVGKTNIIVLCDKINEEIHDHEDEIGVDLIALFYSSPSLRYWCCFR